MVEFCFVRKCQRTEIQLCTILAVVAVCDVKICVMISAVME